MTHTWNGNSNTDFEKFLAQQRHAWIKCTRCVDNIQCVVTDERSRVGYLLENVSGDFPNIMAAMALIRFDDTDTGTSNEFEKAFAYLLPIAEQNKKGPKKRAHGRISQVIAPVSAAKAGSGPSVVEYRFHSIPEYTKLGEEERRDIHQWRKDNPELF